MSTSENAALARRWFEEVWNQKRNDTVAELLADPCVARMEGGDIRNPKEFLAARAALFGAFPDVRVIVESTIAQGDEVAVRWSATGTHLGEHMGPAASRKTIPFRGITWMKFENGRVVEGWDSWNLGKLLSEMQAAAEEASRLKENRAASPDPSSQRSSG